MVWLWIGVLFCGCAAVLALARCWIGVCFVGAAAVLVLVMDRRLVGAGAGAVLARALALDRRFLFFGRCSRASAGVGPAVTSCHGQSDVMSYEG